MRQRQIVEDDVTLDLKEGAAVVGIKPLTLRQKAVYAREVAFYRVGRRLVFRRSDLEAYMERCRVPARAEARR